MAAIECVDRILVRTLKAEISLEAGEQRAIGFVRAVLEAHRVAKQAQAVVHGAVEHLAQIPLEHYVVALLVQLFEVNAQTLEQLSCNTSYHT